MSFILDALRKADAQRERDPSRGIHAQPLHATSAGPVPVRDNRRLWWAAIAIGAVAVVAAAWQLITPSAPMVDITPPTPPQVSLPPELAPAAPPAAAPAAAPAPGPAAAIQPPAPPAPPQGVPSPAGIERRGANMGTPSSIRSPPGLAPPAVGIAPAPAPVTAAAPPVAAAVPEAPGNLPKMAITGGVYSANPALRMLIVNGQVFNEGAEPVPGVVLEQIRSNTAVLLYRGARYTVPF